MLRIEHLTKQYRGGKKAVDDLSLVVEAGDIFGFIGHNGAGKTTTLRCVAGILDFDGGDIFIDGKSIQKDALACKAMTAYIPDNPDIYEYLTGIQYLHFICDIYGVDKTVRAQRIERYAGALELLENLGNLIGSYSHGMRQKLAIISALVHQPKLLILDEPFVGLDPKAAHSLKKFMQEICDAGSAIFFSTHVLEVAQRLCTKVAIIRDGRLVAYGATADVCGDQSLEEVFLELIDDESV